MMIDEEEETENQFARYKENANKMRNIIMDFGLPTEVIRDMMKGDDKYGGASIVANLGCNIASIASIVTNPAGPLEKPPGIERYNVGAVLARNEEVRRSKQTSKKLKEDSSKNL